jgi:hypothetical protein
MAHCVSSCSTPSRVGFDGDSLAAPMSALGQKLTSRHVRVMSVIPRKADIDQRGLHVRLVPEADMQSLRYSAMCSPDPPNSLGKSLNFGSPSRIGSTVSA